MKHLLPVLCLFLAGCGIPESLFGIKGAAGEAAARKLGAQAADGFLEAAIFRKCKAATVGSIDRRYGDDPAAWRADCRAGKSFLDPDDLLPLPPRAAPPPFDPQR